MSEEMGMYCVWDKELPEVIQALQFHIERLGTVYANDADLDPKDGARRIAWRSCSSPGGCQRTIRNSGGPCC